MELLLLHLTDIHIDNENDYKQISKRSELISNVVNMHITDSESTLVLICVTGDITNSSKEEQYFWASLFFEDITRRLKNRYSKIPILFISVPGNHDCNFNMPEEEVRKTILASPELDMNNPKIIEICTNIQQEYFNFTNIISGLDYYQDGNCHSPLNNLIFTENIFKINSVTLKFHCINTAWCSSISEQKGNIRLTIPTLNAKEDNEIVITLMHHDESWLDWNSSNTWRDYYKRFSDFILVGHDHINDFIHKENFCKASNYFIKGNQFYSSKNPNQSGFNILKIDLSCNNQRFFSYELDGKRYKNIIDTKSQQFVRNKYKEHCIELNDDIKEYLENIELEIVSKSRENLCLSDVYVFPVVRSISLENINNLAFYKNKIEIMNLIKRKKFISITGEKESGKTALIKQLFLAFRKDNLFPVLIDVNKIDSVDGEELNIKVANFYRATYKNIENEMIMQMDQDYRVCLIDNFEEIRLMDKSVKKFLQFLENKFGAVIISSHFHNEMVNLLRNIETNKYLSDNFTEINIQELRSYGKRKMIDKWLLLSDPEQNIYSQEFDVLRKNKIDQVNSVMKRGYFNKTPIEFLLVLSCLDNYEKMNTVYSRYSYIVSVKPPRTYTTMK